MRLILLAATIFFAFDAYARATAILAVWFPTFVIIAADSREVMKSGPPQETCKISVVGDVAVAEAGVLDFQPPINNTTRIDTLVRIELGKDEPIATRLKSIESQVLGLIIVYTTPEKARAETSLISVQDCFSPTMKAVAWSRTLMPLVMTIAQIKS